MKTDQWSDQQLVERARSGDQAAWTALVRRYQQPAFRLAYLSLRDADDAEDVAQEAFVRVYRSLDTFDGDRPFQPWLLQIVVNLARNRQRSIMRYLAQLNRWRNEQPVAAGDGHEERQRAERLWQATMQLSQKGREVVYCRYFLQLPVDETAAILKIKPGTVKSRTSRALSELRLIVYRDFPELAE